MITKFHKKNYIFTFYQSISDEVLKIDLLIKQYFKIKFQTIK